MILKRLLRRFRLRTSIFVLVCWQFWTTPTIAGPELVIPDEIRNALINNAKSIEPITIEWKLQRRSNRTIEDLVKDLGSKRYDFYQPETGTVVLQNRMYYKYERQMRNPPPPEKNKGKLTTQEYTSSFDGDAYFILEQGAIKTYVVFTVDEIASGDATPEVIKRSGFRIRNGELPQSEILSHLKSGGKLLSIAEENIGDARCVVLQVVPEQWTYPYWKDREYKYYLDVQKNYAVTQIDWVLPTGRLLCRIKNSNWQKLEQPEIWLPKLSSCEWHTWHYCPDKAFKEVFFYEDFTVSDFTRKRWPLSKFSPDLTEPGVLISDPRPEAKSKPGAIWNASSKKWDYTNLPKFSGLQLRAYGSLRIILNIVVILLLGFAVFLKYRHSMKQKQSA